MQNDINSKIEAFMEEAYNHLYTMDELLATGLFTSEDVYNLFCHFEQFYITAETEILLKKKELADEYGFKL